MDQVKSEDLARQERNRYARNWRAKNPDKVKAIQENYWKRRAERMISEQQKEQS